ncbi:MAG: AAA family ATPase [Saccharofermentanales bacterium]
MKILELRFKNLNSLYGEWKIDLTAPEYEADGIFAITGPTGSGKSTILDAICLALYGQTPRLSRINKNSNEIMSRQTGECYAEVVFESKSGCYRCTWRQHRAHKKPDGNLVDAIHEIANGKTGEILETKKTATVALIEEKTGMDMARFTRSILLAQGEFTAFLQASADDKSPILEQITGTEIYSQLSRDVFERQKEIRNELNLLTAELSGVILLDQNEIQEIKTEQNRLQQSQQETERHLADLRAKINWLSNIILLEQQVQTVQKEKDLLDQEQKDFLPQRAALVRAEKAAVLEGDYVVLTRLRGRQLRDEAALVEIRRQMQEHTEKLAEHTSRLNLAIKEVAAAKAETDRQTPAIRQARVLEGQIETQKNVIDDLVGEISRMERQLEKNRNDRQQIREKNQQHTDQLTKVTEEMTRRLPDAALVTAMTGITEKLTVLLGRVNEQKKYTGLSERTEQDLNRVEAEHRKAVRELNTSKKDHQEKEAAAIEAGRKLENHLDGRPLREYRQDQENLLRELGLRKKIADLETERRALIAGRPCPLCGSTTHPYSSGQKPEPDETERRLSALRVYIDQAEQLEEAVREADRRLLTAEKRVDAANQALALIMADRKRINGDLTRLQNERQSCRERVDILTADLQKMLRPLGITEIDPEKIQEINTTLQARLQNWQELQAEKTSLESGMQRFAAEATGLDALIASAQQAYLEKTALLAKQQDVLGQLKSRQVKILSGLSADQMETKLKRALARAEQDRDQAKATCDLSKEERDAARIRSEQLQTELNLLAPDLALQEKNFHDALGKGGFTSEEDFKEQRLDADQRKALAELAKTLDTRLTETQTRLKDKKAALEETQKLALTIRSPEELKEELTVRVEKNQQISRAIGAIEQRLAADDQARAASADKTRKIADLKKDWLQWNRLNELIGSADGKKFRNFAQGITFEVLISHANRQLTRMTDRYLLIKDTDAPLELNVVDNYQAGEIRTTKNLSGGESFLVSLALALGLSRMSSRKVPVDSLFLDEGFGTLDEDTLETALETLAGLPQDGKLIGVISHIPALKERIAAHISIEPIAGGRSIITGPGVTYCSS